MKVRLVCTLCAIAAGCTPPAADEQRTVRQAIHLSWDHCQAARPDGLAPGDAFGTSAAISYEAAFIGGNEAAWAFTRDQEGAVDWVEDGPLPASPPAGSQFGAAVALNGDNSGIVGAPGASRIYPFSRDDQTQPWSGGAALSGPAGSEFGAALAVDGDRLFVGAPGENAVYVLERPTGTWEQTLRLVPLDGVVGDRFGAAIAARDGKVVIGAPDRAGTGTVYVYSHADGPTLTMLGEIAPADLAAGDAFGAAVAVASSTAVVGVPGSDAFGSDAGAVLAFDYDDLVTDPWPQVAAFGAEVPQPGQRFGSAVTYGDGYVLASTDPSADGIVSAFHRDIGDGWGTLGNKESPLSGTARFGAAIAGDNEDVAIGAPGDAEAGANAGAAVFCWNNHYPVAADDEFTVVSAAPWTSLDVLANDFDPDGEPLTLQVQTSPAHGTFRIDDDGTSLRYIADDGYLGADTFEYRVVDGLDATAVGTVNVTVVVGNDGVDPNDLCAITTCPATDVCYAGTCYRACEASSGCAVGDGCYDGRCTSDPCEGTTCEETETCWGGGCFATCTGDEDCDGGSCFGGRCADDVCEAITCPTEQACYGGACFGGCTRDADCEEGSCFSGRCTVDPCDMVQCASGLVCFAGTCFPGCTSDAECPADTACFDGRCAADACAGIQCPQSLVCEAGECREPAVDSGCGCSAVTHGIGLSPWFAGLLLLGVRRRRRRRRGVTVPD